jgi:flagellar protein FlgJ
MFMTPESFVSTYYPFAKQTEAKTGMSAIALLAQAALESDWGRKSVGNMMFGIKAGKNTPENKKQLIVTTEYLSTPNAKFPEVLSVLKHPNGKYKYVVKDWFMKYDSPEESFTDHARFIEENQRYAKALLVKDNPDLFVMELAKAGYATAPNYGVILQDMIKSVKKRLPKDIK